MNLQVRADQSPIPAGEDEAALIQRAVAGELAAFELIMRRHNRRLYRLARATLGDAAEAKDVLQDAYLSVYRALPQFRGEALLGTWLSRIVLNECFARQRRSLRRSSVVSIMSIESQLKSALDVADPREAPDMVLSRAQMRELLERHVGELPDSLRLVFVLRSVEELSVEDTSRTLEISEEAVRTRHFRAKALLRERLARAIDLAEGDIYDFGGCDCDAMVAAVLARLVGSARAQ